MLPVLALGLMLSLIALPVIADNQNSNSNSTNKAVDLTKMQTAIDTRDTSILLAWDTYSDVVKGALEARKTALKAAWTLTDKTTRRTAIKVNYY